MYLYMCCPSLLYTKVKLEAMCRGPEEALLTCKHMLQIWKSFYNLTNPRYTHTRTHTHSLTPQMQISVLMFVLVSFIQTSD